MILQFDTKWLDAISDLDDALRLTLLDGIFAYLEGKEPVLGSEASMLFCAIRPFIDEVNNKRIRIAERNRENGMKGGRKPKAKRDEKPKGKTFDDYLQEPEYQGRCENLLKLDEWMKNHTPYVYRHIPPMTNKEFENLMRRGYTSKEICDTLEELENRKDLRKRYVSLYRTLLNWMKRNYG